MRKQNGVDVWPNAAIWMLDELRSKVRIYTSYYIPTRGILCVSTEGYETVFRRSFWHNKYTLVLIKSA